MKRNATFCRGNDSYLIWFLFYVHLLVVAVLFGSFFIPQSIWIARPFFHFWYFVMILLVEVIWGFILYLKTKKFDIVCPLTTWMQYLRGFAVTDRRNYDHSYIAELLSRFGVKVPYKYVSYLILVAGVFVVFNYWRAY